MSAGLKQPKTPQKQRNSVSYDAADLYVVDVTGLRYLWLYPSCYRN